MPVKRFMHPALPLFTRRRMTSTQGKEYWGFEKVNLGTGRKPAGPFWIRHTATDGKQKWVSAGDDYAATVDQRDKMLAVKLADHQGLSVDDADRREEANIGSMTLGDAIEAFKTAKTEMRPRTQQAYSTTLENFKTCIGTKARFISELTPDHVYRFIDCMKAAKKAKKTISTRTMYVRIFLNWLADEEHTDTAVKVDSDRVLEAPKKKVLAYSDEQLRKLMAVAVHDEAAVLSFFLARGAVTKKEHTQNGLTLTPNTASSPCSRRPSGASCRRATKPETSRCQQNWWHCSRNARSTQRQR